MTPLMDLAGNGKMDWFFHQWVYGTVVPRYKFDYTLDREVDGKVRLKASLAQSEVSDDCAGRIVRLGSVAMKGNSTNSNLDVMLPIKPKRVRINENYDVLARK